LGFLAETDEAIFVETKASKRIAHFKSTKFPARTLTDGIPDSQSVDDFNLQEHLDLLSAKQSTADEFSM